MALIDRFPIEAILIFHHFFFTIFGKIGRLLFVFFGELLDVVHVDAMVLKHVQGLIADGDLSWCCRDGVGGGGNPASCRLLFRIVGVGMAR